MTKAIVIDRLTKLYNGHAAVNELSLTIEKGEVFGLLGPNGAGRTTTILMTLGLIEPTDGEIYVGGVDPLRNPIEVKRCVGYLPANLGFYQHLTGLENLVYMAQLNGIKEGVAKEKALDLLGKVGLSDAANKKTGEYSRGMKQRLGLAEVLIKDPEIIILDEPTLGIDPEGVREILSFIRSLSEEEGKTILLSSHHLHQVQEICDRVGIFVKGELLAEGNVTELAEQLFFKDSYVVQVRGNSIDEALLNKVEKIKDVNRVEEVAENEINIYCKKNITSRLARMFLEAGVDLHHFSKEDYGLDEIYHRYFEGRDEA